MKHVGAVRRAVGVAAVAIVLAAACKTIVEEMPNGPTGGPAPTPVPVVVVPVPIPTAPPPTQAPAPPSQPGPAPTPGANPPPPPAQPPPPPSGGSCSLPPGNGPGVNCPAESPSFQGEVESSINQLIQQRPDIFSGGGSAPHVVKHSEYMNGVVANLRARGLCAIVDSDDEIAVKNTNAFSDQYDILLSTGQVRRAYTATCRPAWF
jgi:hypothetical protein